MWTGRSRWMCIAASPRRAGAVVSGRIYWSSLNNNSIEQAKTDGTGILNNLVTGADEGGPQGIAITGSALRTASASPDALDFGPRPLQDYGTPKSLTITDTGPRH